MPSRATNNQSNVYQLQTGVEGSFRNGDWTWEAYVSHGETTIDSYLYAGWASDQRYKQVAQAPNFGRGFTQTSATGALGFNIRCTTGLPLVADFTPSADCIDAMDARMKQFTRLEQTIVEANLQGGIVDMRSGELRVRRRNQQPREYGAVRARSARRRAIHARQPDRSVPAERDRRRYRRIRDLRRAIDSGVQTARYRARLPLLRLRQRRRDRHVQGAVRLGRDGLVPRARRAADREPRAERR